EEGADGFAVVARVSQLAHEIALEVELRLQRVGRARVDRLLDAREAARGRVREAANERFDLVGELGIVDAFPDEPPIRRLLRRYLLAEERDAHRARCADQPREKIRAAGIGNEA